MKSPSRAFPLIQRRQPRVPLLCATACLLIASAVGAAQRESHLARIYLNLTRGRIGLTLEGTDELDKERNPYTIRANETAEIWIADPNTLLLGYEAECRSTETEERKTALKFAESLSLLLDRFPGSAGAGASAKSVVEGIDLLAVRETLDTLVDVPRDAQGWIDASLDPTRAKALRSNGDIAAAATAAKNVRQIYRSIEAIQQKCNRRETLSVETGESVGCDGAFDLRPLITGRKLEIDKARLAQSINDADADIKQRTAAVAQATQAGATASQTFANLPNTATNEAKALAKAEMERLNRESTRAKNGLVLAREKAVALRKDFSDLDDRLKEAFREEITAAAGPTIREFVHQAIARKVEILQNADLAQEFAKDVKSLGDPIRVTENPYSLDLQTCKVTVAAVGKYEDLMSDSAKGFVASQEKRAPYSVTVAPHRGASVRPGAGFVLGFLRNPVFTTKKEGDAFRIVQTDESLTRYNVAAMLNIVPARWNEPTFGGFFQVGVSPKKDETGLYFGAGISVESVFTLGAGVMMQQVGRLAPGLSLDTPIAKAEDLKVEHPFRPALYIHATVTVGSKKK